MTLAPREEWAAAVKELESRPIDASGDAVNAARLLSFEARALEGMEQDRALEENIGRIEELLPRMVALEPKLGVTAYQELRMVLAQDAVSVGDLELAEATAESVLASNTDPKSWIYGKALHDMNLVLAEIAWWKGNKAEARRRALQASRSPGSPQLNSIGPRFPIVVELYRDGDDEVLIEYLENVSKFWKSEQPKKWLESLRAGREPNDALWIAATRN